MEYYGWKGCWCSDISRLLGNGVFMYIVRKLRLAHYNLLQLALELKDKMDSLGNLSEPLAVPLYQLEDRWTISVTRNG